MEFLEDQVIRKFLWPAAGLWNLPDNETFQAGSALQVTVRASR
jgi:hypothetical protein